MVRSKTLITAAGTLACAVGIGFIMQQSDTAEAHYGGGAEAGQQNAMPVLEGASAGNAVLDVQEITLTSAEYETGISLPEPEAEVITASAPDSVLEEPTVPEVGLDPACEITATARPIAAAMVDLGMSAPCFPNERVTIHHNGMIFTETTSAEGTVGLIVPALTKEAVFIVAFPNGEGAVAQTTVEELANFERSVVQWKGNTGFQIHALEFGANYNADGHVWEGAPGTLAGAVTGSGGLLTRHGDTDAAEPLLAEVYTFPRNAGDQSGDIALSVEAEVTEANCGLEIEAQSLEVQSDGQIKTQNLTLSVPECDAKGSFLVLNNLLQDLKVAGK